FAFFTFLFLSFTVMNLAIYFESLRLWSPISVRCLCRVVSSSVDLRSSKVCAIGVLNYNAKNVLYPLEKNKYRCHYDYYWAAILKVEFTDHLGHERFALAEAPNEALPYNCRPSFSGAWLTKSKFMINETYDCWYTLGISKVNINHEGLFNCRADDPSTLEMMKLHSTLLIRILKSSFSGWGSLMHWRWDVIAGLTTGFITALLVIALVSLIWPLIQSTTRLLGSWLFIRYPITLFLKRAFVFTVYLMFMCWITLQYLRRL
ncbi:hypothetical protein M569_15336, partial [Genlisea aurea]